MTIKRYFLLPLILCFSACADNREELQGSHGQDATNHWITVGGDTDETRYSELSQIDVTNVSELGAWDYDTKTNRGLEATPIMVDGVIYTTGTWGKVYAVDAKTGVEK